MNDGFVVKSLDFIEDRWVSVDISTTLQDAIECAKRYGESNTTMTKHIRIINESNYEMVWEKIVFCRTAKKGEEHKIFCGGDGGMFYVVFDWYTVH